MALRDRLANPPTRHTACKFGAFLAKLEPEDRDAINNALALVGKGWTLKGIAREILAEYPMLSSSPEALDDAIRRHRGHDGDCGVTG